MPNLVFRSRLVRLLFTVAWVSIASHSALRAEDPSRDKPDAPISKSTAAKEVTKRLVEKAGSAAEDTKEPNSDKTAAAEKPKRTAREQSKVNAEREILKKSIRDLPPQKHIIGATTFVVEKQTNLEFQARVDTGRPLARSIVSSGRSTTKPNP